MERETSGFSLLSCGPLGKTEIIPPSVSYAKVKQHSWATMFSPFFLFWILPAILNKVVMLLGEIKSISLPYAFFFPVCKNLGRTAISMRFLFCVVVTDINFRFHANASRPA